MSHGAPPSREGVWDSYVLLTIGLVEGFWELERKHAVGETSPAYGPYRWSLLVHRMNNVTQHIKVVVV
jgi:hypothetical protein